MTNAPPSSDTVGTFATGNVEVVDDVEVVEVVDVVGTVVVVICVASTPPDGLAPTAVVVVTGAAATWL
jgi:hypothetical protein